jgi:diketogulonate reductase-like aldo/keto reductase
MSVGTIFLFRTLCVYCILSSLGNQWRRGNPVFKNDVLQRIAAEHESIVSSVVLTWVLSTGAIIIPKSSKEDHVVANAQLMIGDRNLQLTVENLADIAKLDGSIGKPWE